MADAIDNCPLTPNAIRSIPMVTHGGACDPDVIDTTDGITDALDNCPLAEQ